MDQFCADEETVDIEKMMAFMETSGGVPPPTTKSNTTWGPSAPPR